MQFSSMLSFYGNIIMILGVALLLPVLPGIYYAEQEWFFFFVAGTIVFLLGFFLNKLTLKYRDELFLREALLLVPSTWLLASALSTAVYSLTNTFDSLIDAFFESMAGFTTTGATVINNLEMVPTTVLFWRSLTHWLGGMGIIILFVAIMSSLKIGAAQLFKAEIPGGVIQKIKPRISQTALILWSIYTGMTLLVIILLFLSGMPLFDAICHGFATVATAGCSIKNENIGFYNNSLIYWVITIFMFLAGSNFVLFYSAFKEKSLIKFWQNAEFRLYTKIILVFIGLMTAHLVLTENMFPTTALTLASFSIVSSVTTTGFAIVDYQNWSSWAQTIIIFLFLIGGCTGSTAGSIKIGRYQILFKQFMAELRQTIHPRAIINLKSDGKNIEERLVIHVLLYFFVFVFLIFLATFLLVYFSLDFITAFSATIACLTNGGLGLSLVGPGHNFNVISPSGKILLSFLMLLGRLEIYTVLVLFTPAFWKK